MSNSGERLTADCKIWRYFSLYSLKPERARKFRKISDRRECGFAGGNQICPSASRFARMGNKYRWLDESLIVRRALSLAVWVAEF